jgi:hypothetical protein
MKVYGFIDEDVLKLCKVYENYHTSAASREYNGGRIPHVFTEYTIDHSGGRIPYVFTEYGYDQNGDGIGSILKGLWRMFQPVVMAGARAVGNQAVSSAGNYLGDLASGANWKEAGKARLGEAGNNLKDKLEQRIKRMAGSGKRHLPLDFQSTHEPAAKIQKMIESMNKRDPSKLNAFSITAPPVKAGRDLRLKKKLVKNKFKGAKVSKRKSARLAGKPKHKYGKGLVGYGDLLF